MKKKLIRIKNYSNIADALNQFPIVLIEGGEGNATELHQVVNQLNGEIKNEVFNPVRVLNSKNTINNSIGASSEPHPPHTDGCYTKNPPSHIILQCVEPEKKMGGLGLFWDLENYIKFLPKSFLNILESCPVRFSRVREDGFTRDSFDGLILENEISPYGNWAIRWRYDTQLRPQLLKKLSGKHLKIFNDAIAYTVNYFQVELPIVIPYKRGDILIASNRCMVHGRTRILDKTRIMHRSWLRF